MPNTYLSRLIALSVLVFLLIFLPGWLFIGYLERKSIDYIMQKCLNMARALWNSVTSTNQEAIEAYFEKYILKEDVIKLLELAKEDPTSARTLIYKQVWQDYNRLTEKLKVRNIIFLLPDGRVLLRMRTPTVYDDVMPFMNNPRAVSSGFGTDGILSGWFYSFPVVKGNGEHLGTVVITVPLEHLRRILQNLNAQASYLFLFSENMVMHMVLPEYSEYYGTLEGLSGWFIEDPYRKLHDSPTTFSDYEKVILKKLVRNEEFRRHLHSPTDSYVILESGGRYYKVMMVKLGSDQPLAVLVSIVLGKDIESLKKGHDVYRVGLLLLAVTISAYTFVYLRNVYRLRIKYEEINAIVSLMGAGLVVLNRDGRVELVNEHSVSLLGYKREELMGKLFHEILHYHTGHKESCPVYLAATRGLNYSGDDSLIRKDGTLLDVYLDLRAIFLGGRFVGSVLVFYDISRRKQVEKELYIKATHDQLTGLYNRWFAEDILSRFIDQSERSGKPISLILFDLDHFKKINDTYGHQVGDLVLKRVAEIIKNNVRAYDIPIRWGGEEFMVILPDADEVDAYHVAERIRSLIEKENIENLHITVSGGVATRRRKEDIKTLINRADLALYEAKRSGRNMIVVAEG
ncbi:MAG: sensor domain-containing diguanylate cyclase [Aquificaceae bacterium]|nr:sensor domain-containing diguanylate cyclase [Aquificaceae bacterium]MDW8423769.1 sensor domain-containing diguanylate cyclase [Aquificaceae bacterium]